MHLSSIGVFVKQEIPCDNAQMKNKSGELEKLRAQIDAVDKDIITALSERVRLVESVGKYKLAHRISFLDKKRRDHLLRLWTARGKSLRLPTKLVRDIFFSLHRHSLSVEKNIKC